MPRIKIGDCVWRPVSFRGARAAVARPYVENVRFQNVGRGVVIVRAIARAKAPHYFLREGLLAASGSRGLVCFCRQLIPRNWIGLEVARVYRNGTSVEVFPVCGGMEMLLAQYEYPGELRSA